MLAALQDFNATGARDPFPSALGGSGLSLRRRGAAAGSSEKQQQQEEEEEEEGEEEEEEEGSGGSDAEAVAEDAAGNSEELAAIEADYYWQPADAPELAEGSRIEVFTELEDLQHGGVFTQWLAAHVTKVDLKPRKQKGGSKGKKSKKGKQVLDKWMRLEYDDGLVHSTYLWPMDFNKGRSGLGWRLDRDFYDKDAQGNCLLTAKSKLQKLNDGIAI